MEPAKVEKSEGRGAEENRNDIRNSWEQPEMNDTHAEQRCAKERRNESGAVKVGTRPKQETGGEDRRGCQNLRDTVNGHQKVASGKPSENLSGKACKGALRLSQHDA